MMPFSMSRASSALTRAVISSWLRRRVSVGAMSGCSLGLGEGEVGLPDVEVDGAVGIGGFVAPQLGGGESQGVDVFGCVAAAVARAVGVDEGAVCTGDHG